MVFPNPPKTFEDCQCRISQARYTFLWSNQ